MDESTKTILKWAAIAGGLWLLYRYLEQSGQIAQWFGTSQPPLAANSFTSQPALIAYCAANPTGTATMVDASGKPTTLPCITWLVNNVPPPSPPPGQANALVQGADPVPGADLATRLRLFAGVDSATVDQWNGFMVQMQAGAPPLAPVSSGMIDSETYIALRNAAGLSGFAAAPSGLGWNGPSYEDPFGWVN